MPNGTPDFRFRSQFPIASVAQLIAQKPVIEEQMRRQRFNQFLNTLTTSAQLARSGQAFARERQLQGARTELADMLAEQEVPSGLEPGMLGPITPDVAERRETIRQAAIVDPVGAASKGLGIARVGTEGRGRPGCSTDFFR